MSCPSLCDVMMAFLTNTVHVLALLSKRTISLNEPKP